MAKQRAFILLAFLQIAALSGQLAWAETVAPTPDAKIDAKIAQAIENLGSDSPDVALAAEQELQQLGDQALPALRKATKEGAPNIRDKAKGVIARQVTRQIENLGSSSKPLADAAEESLLHLKYLAADALDTAAKADDGERSTRAARILKKMLVHSHVVLDALGQPIEGGTLEATFQISIAPNTPDRTVKASQTPDERGFVSLQIPPGVSNLSWRFEHSDYGRAQRDLYGGEQRAELRFPLVNLKSAAGGRAVKGAVVTADFRPVAGAIISSNLVWMPGGGNLQPPSRVFVISDAKGKFAYYPFREGNPTTPAPAVAHGAKYSFSVSVPDDPAIFPRRLDYANPGDTMIKLERAERFHKFKFTNAEGGFLSEPEIKRVSVAYAKDAKAPRVDLNPGWAVTGAKLLPGVYYARAGNSAYLPLVVTKDSEEELTFRYRESLAIHGRVLDGVTGKPAAGVLVFGFSSSRYQSLAHLTDDQWRALRDMPADAKITDPVFEPLAKSFRLDAFAHTDEQGQYTIIQKPSQDISAVIAAGQDLLPIQAGKTETTVDASVKDVTLPDLMLFPAAKAMIQSAGAKPGTVVPVWRFEKEGQPEWFARFTAMTEQKPYRRFLYDDWLMGKLQPVYVPAGARLRIGLRHLADDSTSGQTPDVLQFQPRETRQIGEVATTPALEVEAQVVDAAGKPLADVNVRRLSDRVWSNSRRTNAEGRVRLFVHRYSSGSIGVWIKQGIFSAPKQDQEPNLFAPFDVQDAIPADKTYKITLTAEQVDEIQKQRAGRK